MAPVVFLDAGGQPGTVSVVFSGVVSRVQRSWRAPVALGAASLVASACGGYEPAGFYEMTAVGAGSDRCPLLSIEQVGVEMPSLVVYTGGVAPEVTVEVQRVASPAAAEDPSAPSGFAASCVFSTQAGPVVVVAYRGDRLRELLVDGAPEWATRASDELVFVPLGAGAEAAVWAPSQGEALMVAAPTFVPRDETFGLLSSLAGLFDRSVPAPGGVLAVSPRRNVDAWLATLDVSVCGSPLDVPVAEDPLSGLVVGQSGVIHVFPDSTDNEGDRATFGSVLASVPLEFDDGVVSLGGAPVPAACGTDLDVFAWVFDSLRAPSVPRLISGWDEVRKLRFASDAMGFHVVFDVTPPTVPPVTPDVSRLVFPAELMPAGVPTDPATGGVAPETTSPLVSPTP